jgi:hypothetical protein
VRNGCHLEKSTILGELVQFARLFGRAATKHVLKKTVKKSFGNIMLCECAYDFRGKFI